MKVTVELSVRDKRKLDTLQRKMAKRLGVNKVTQSKVISALLQDA